MTTALPMDHFAIAITGWGRHAVGFARLFAPVMTHLSPLPCVANAGTCFDRSSLSPAEDARLASFISSPDGPLVAGMGLAWIRPGWLPRLAKAVAEDWNTLIFLTDPAMSLDQCRQIEAANHQDRLAIRRHPRTPAEHSAVELRVARRWLDRRASVIQNQDGALWVLRTRDRLLVEIMITSLDGRGTPWTPLAWMGQPPIPRVRSGTGC